MEIFRIRDIDPIQLANICSAFIGKVRDVLPDADIREVGSTAVPTIGKQDIDILVRVERSEFELARKKLDATFERDCQQISNEEYQAYSLSREPDVSIQLIVRGCQYDVFLPFIEALQQNPLLLREYEKLKRDWDGKSMRDYRQAKAGFIDRVLRKIGKRGRE